MKKVVSLLIIVLFSASFFGGALISMEKLPDATMDNPYTLTIQSQADVVISIFMNDKTVLQETLLKAGNSLSVDLKFEVPRNTIRIVVRNMNNLNEEQIFVKKILYLSQVDAVVDKNFTGNDGESVNGVPHFTSISAALEFLKNSKNDEEKRKYIFIKSGNYYEKITIDIPNLSLVGEDVLSTKIYYDDAAGKTLPDGKKIGTSKSASVTIKGSATGFTAENITFENSFDEQNNPEITSKQAVAVLTQSDRAVFINCRFIGNQDTLYVRNGLHYFRDCYIEGDVDFIFGDGRAVFEDCVIFSVDRPGIKPKGYITAASTKKDNLGFLFTNCVFTSNVTDKNSVYLGRPWHPSSDPYSVNSNVVIRESYLGEHIHMDGWTSMSSKDPKTGEKIWFYPETERFFEYQNYGPGAIINEKRPQLEGENVELYSKEKFLDDWDVERFIEQLYQ
ncbi:Pectinesterase [Thermotoga sp. RQ2]|nr:pectinesterase family protein [Thermotoga sp. RQ2]ACB08857.1 Pectinesterase [Thermotoga sp. RQ2]